MDIREGSSASAGGVSKSGGKLWVEGGLTTIAFDEQLLYETDFSTWALITEAAWATWSVYLNQTGNDTLSQLMDFVRDAITPEVSWTGHAFNLYSTDYLEAGTEYTWAFFVASSVAAGAFGNVRETALFDTDVYGLTAENEYLGGSGDGTPRITSFYGNPDPVTQGGYLLLPVETSDPDGAVEKVEFYWDSNYNGSLDIGQDELIGTDTNAVNDFFWFGVADFPYGTRRFFARAQDDEGLWSEVATTLVQILQSEAQAGSAFSITDYDWDDDTSNGDEDGVMEAGELLELEVELRSNFAVTNVHATLTTSDSIFDDFRIKYPVEKKSVTNINLCHL